MVMLFDRMQENGLFAFVLLGSIRKDEIKIYYFSYLVFDLFQFLHQMLPKNTFFFRLHHLVLFSVFFLPIFVLRVPHRTRQRSQRIEKHKR